MPPLFVAIVIGLLGLVVGSFLNALIWRLKVKRSVLHGRSMCPRCRQTLSPTELVPVVSYLVLRGRCRHCRRPISFWYPAVELAMAALYVLAWVRFGLSLELLVSLIVFPFLVVIFVYDAQKSLILDRISLPGAAVAAAGSLLLGLSFWNVAGGAILGAGFFALQYLFSGGRWVGGGDIRLGLLIGAFLGWPGVLIALCLAYVSGSIVGLWLVGTKRKTIGSAIPFGTFLASSTVVVHLYGHLFLPYFT